MDIFTRIPRKTLDARLYSAFQKNDAGLALRYASDMEILQRNKAVCSWEGVEYVVLGGEGQDVLDTEAGEIGITIRCSYPVDIRLDKVLSRMLHISREKIRKMGLEGILCLEDGKDLTRCKVKDGLRVSWKKQGLRPDF